jgi:uncharacterized membrane protein YgcG
MRSSLLEDLTGRLRGKAPASETPATEDVSEPLGDAEWPTQVHARSVRLRPLTALLTVALVAIGGIWGGAELQKRHGSGATASGNSGLAAALASRFGNRTGAGGGTGGFGGGGAAAGGGATTGTVTEVTKKTLYLTTSTGALVKIGLTSATTFTRTAKSPKGGLALGDTAIVIGAKNASGLIVATSVIATQKGVTATRGGFGGGGFGGGGFGGGGNSTGGGAASG